MPTFRDVSRAVTARLEAAGILPDEARLDAELLVRDLQGWDRGVWITHAHLEAESDLADRLEPLVARRMAREPMAYIRGRCEFWGREFAITRAVLIPRPETELIVETALRLVDSASATVADVGTGSGCIGITLALERPGWRLCATDISEAALQVATGNAARHAVSERLSFERAALSGSGAPNRFDAMVSNPPYVPSGDRDGLQPEVRYEPDEALFGGADGLDVVRALVDDAISRLVSRGWLIFEFGFGQDTAVRTLLESTGRWSDIEIQPDLQGIPRTAGARRR